MGSVRKSAVDPHKKEHHVLARALKLTSSKKRTGRKRATKKKKKSLKIEKQKSRTVTIEKNLTEEIITKPKPLSEDQKRAVLSRSRHVRVIAGAGAGKTEVLTRRIAYLLLVKKADPHSIVAFTFTERAAQTLKDRIYRRVEEHGGPGAAANLGQMYIGTIHGYSKRVLEDHFHYGNHGVLDENKEVAFIMRHGWPLHVRTFGYNFADGCRNFLRTVNMVWAEMINEKKLKRKAPDFYEKLKLYEGYLERHKQITFGRMIYECVLELKKRPDTLSHVKHLAVDEYQDINQAQAELIDLIGKKASIFVVGDPRQSIYQWRGSDEKFFRIFSKTFKGTKEIVIPENRRSTIKIVENANKFAESFERTRYDSMDPTRPEEGFIGISSHETPDLEASWIADQIERIISENDLSYSDIGILTRSVRTSARPLIDILRERRIPYIIGGKVGLFRRDEAQALGRIFAWFWEEGFWIENAWNWSQRTVGEDLLHTALEHWNRTHPDGAPSDAEEKLRKLKDDLYNTQKYRNFTKIYQEILRILGFLDLDYDDPNQATVIANLGRFGTLLTDYEAANRLGGKTPKWKRDLQGLCWFMNTHAIRAYEEQPSDDIRVINAVQIMTIHQAKGLEWPIVFLFSSINKRFPPSLVGRQQNWCGVPRELFNAARYEGDIEDERRLFYVAITRARDALIVSYFNRLNRPTRRSRFIENMKIPIATYLRDGAQLPALKIETSSFSDEMQTFSAGEIIDYVICPYMYLFRKLLGFQSELNERIGYGHGLHYCLRRASERIKSGEENDPLDAIKISVDEDFDLPYAGGKMFDRLKNAAKKQLVQFTTKYGNDLRIIEEVEYRIEFPIHEATIMGKVDVILREGGGREVREYKTSEEAKTMDETSIQVRLYVAGLRNLQRAIDHGSVAYIKETEIKSADITEPAISATIKDTEKVVSSIKKRNFKPDPEKPNCKRCDYPNICRHNNSINSKLSS
ncbi:ATP-dependent helicase [Thermoproteota archaeon]